MARRRKRDNIKDSEIDYKNLELLKKHINDTGSILPSRNTGLSAPKQRKMAKAIKLARLAALLPFCDNHR